MSETNVEFERLVIPPISEALTQEQVNQLADGTIVVVLWVSGNGPAKYELTSHYGLKYTLDSFGHMVKDPLDFVGMERWNTKVWLAG